MTERKRPLFILVVASLLCISILLVGTILVNVPVQAEAIYGPPSASLDAPRRYGYAILLLWQANDLTRPVDTTGGEQPFEISSGESTPSVIGRLEQAGLLRNPLAFRLFLQYSGLDTTLQSGKYKLSPAMSPLQIAHRLQDATPTIVTFNVLPGWRVEEIAAALPSSGLNISPQAFLAAVHSDPGEVSFSKAIPSPPFLEGFLMPGSYEVPRTSTAHELVALFLDNFDRKVSDEMRQGFKRQGLSLYQAVILASIVEREAIRDNEKPIIASVFLNRQKKGMKLDADPTIQYALGSLSKGNPWWKSPLSLDDLKVDSPYNTYRTTGLPPGPIANPGLEALKAVAFPAQTPYYYFRAACDGSGRHEFSETFSEHLQNDCP